ncbi:hypothetical protein [Sorangium sp. So ce1000]|uniref:hypothetical protein n=1 Tax=Sorangium sp. So ce1000 TaxID=3133325 RepID=UPI003F619843
MYIRIGLTMAALMGAPACGAPDEPSDAGAESGGAEDVPPALRSFEVSLDEGTTNESVIPQILEAGRPELAAACADRPEALIRIFNPLDPGVSADVPCAAMLSVDGGDAAAQEQSAVPVSEGGEPIGEAQQRWSPLGLGCSIFVFTAATVAGSAICPRAADPRDAKRCGHYTNVSFGVLGAMCSFL